MPLPEAETIVKYKKLTLKEVLGQKFALNHDPLNLASETAEVAIADSKSDGRFRYTSLAFPYKTVIGESLRQILEASIPKPTKVTERQTLQQTVDDLTLMDSRYPVHVELQMEHVGWVGPDWNGAWNLHDRLPFLKALKTLDPVQRDALFERELSCLITQKQAVAEFPDLMQQAIQHNFNLRWVTWDLLRNACNSYPFYLSKEVKTKINSATGLDDPIPFLKHVPKAKREENINLLHDIKTIIDTKSDPQPIFHKPNRNSFSSVDYAGNRIVVIRVNESWMSVKLSDDGNHKKLGEYKEDPFWRSGIYPIMVIKTDKHTGDSDLIFDIREIPEAILDGVPAAKASARLGINAIAVSSPEQRDLGINPVPVEYRGRTVPRNMIEAQMPTYWCDPRNRALLVPSNLVQGIAAYGLTV